MRTGNFFAESPKLFFLSALSVFLITGCQSAKNQPAGKITTGSTTTPAMSPAPAKSDTKSSAIRIDAGSAANFTDSSGNVWLADQGFTGGDLATRADDLPIVGTKDPAIYRTEHYGMTAFSYSIPNGKYTVKLHFAETYDGISGAGQRVFSFDVEGKAFKDFDVWAKTGGLGHADVETANVEVTDGKLDITFTANVQSPEINGIEIIPGY